MSSVEKVRVERSDLGTLTPWPVSTGAGETPGVSELAGGTTTRFSGFTPAVWAIVSFSGPVTIRLPSRLARLARVESSGPWPPTSTTCELRVSMRMSEEAIACWYWRLCGGNPGLKASRKPIAAETRTTIATSTRRRLIS